MTPPFPDAMLPASDDVPHQRAGNRDQQRLEHIQMAFTQQIPGQNPNEYPNTLGERKFHRAEGRGSQSRFSVDEFKVGSEASGATTI
jgi:hypothetical protein